MIENIATRLAAKATYLKDSRYGNYHWSWKIWQWLSDKLYDLYNIKI